MNGLKKGKIKVKKKNGYITEYGTENLCAVKQKNKHNKGYRQHLHGRRLCKYSESNKQI